MNKKQNLDMLKVHKALVPNHNQAALKVRKTTLKERWILFVYANCRGLTMNHNQTALKVRK